MTPDEKPDEAKDASSEQKSEPTQTPVEQPKPEVIAPGGAHIVAGTGSHFRLEVFISFIFILQMLCIPLFYVSDNWGKVSNYTYPEAFALAFLGLSILNIPLLIWFGIKSRHSLNLKTKYMAWVLLLSIPLVFLVFFADTVQQAAPDIYNKVSIHTNNDKETEGLKLDPNKNYGDKYADGLLPVGDEHFVTDAPKKGYVYVCNDNFVPDSQAGAQTRGPWFVTPNTWNINKKYSVKGSVSWDQNISNRLNGEERTIKTNGLPGHVTGVFPVQSSDPAYNYDKNPNSIKSQSLTYTLDNEPEYLTSPKCMGGEVGVLLTGVALFNGFDAGGRDAGAWEVQDACEGHPQNTGIYHYHTLSSCIKDVKVSTVIGFALDGYPITGPKVGDKNILTTDDLDECHGIVSEITLDGRKVESYHYVMTQDFPYSVSCFRAIATESPGQHTGGQQSSQQQQQQSQQQTGQQPPPKQAPPPRP